MTLAGAARRLLCHVKSRANQFAALEVQHSKDNPAAQYDWRRHSDEIRLLEDMAAAAEIFAYMALEGFLNHYGAVCLGPDFYKANIERLGPDKKAAAILAITANVLLPPSDELMDLLADTSARRNQLVHPKSKPVESSAIQLFAPASLPRRAEAAIQVMEKFQALFGKFHKAGFPLGHF